MAANKDARVQAYLNKFRNPNGRQETDKKGRNDDSQPKSNKPTVVKGKGQGQKYRSKATIESLPNEILLMIFEYLSPNDVLSCSSVCHRWNSLSQNSLLWQGIFKQYVQRRSNIQLSDGQTWKTICLQECEKSRNSQIRPLMKKIDNYTGLMANTEKILRKVSVGFLLIIDDASGCQHVFREKDIFHFRMSVCTRWYSSELPPINRIKRLSLYAVNPLFYDMAGNAIPNSPAKRSLIWQGEVTAQWTKDLVQSTEMIDLYMAPYDFLIATWKGEKELAFIVLNLHSHNLVNKCLKGNSKTPWTPSPAKVLKDDIDRKYGLHDYTCTVELRHMRTSFWNQQFRNLFVKEGDKGGGLARLVLIDPENDYDRASVAKKITFLWKTDAFKGSVQDMCFLDLTLLDDQQNPMWCMSTVVNVHQETNTPVSYNFSGDRFLVQREDEGGKLQMQLSWEQDEKQYYMVGLEVFLKLKFINNWFGTKYS